MLSHKLGDIMKAKEAHKIAQDFLNVLKKQEIAKNQAYFEYIYNKYKKIIDNKILEQAKLGNFYCIIPDQIAQVAGDILPFSNNKETDYFNCMNIIMVEYGKYGYKVSRKEQAYHLSWE